MCQGCIERQSKPFLDVLPEAIDKVRQALVVEERILESFRRSGDKEAFGKVERTVLEMQGNLRQLENIEKSKGDLRPLDRLTGNVNSLGSQDDPRVLRGNITILEEALASAKSAEDEKGIRIRLVVARSRLATLTGDA